MEKKTYDYFLKVDGIPGESEDSDHKGEIEIEGFSWGAERSSDGTVTADNLHIVSRINKASPKLMVACAGNKPISSAVLVGRKDANGPKTYLTITLSDVKVSSYHTGGSGEMPRDEVTLSFNKIKIEVKEQKKDGTLGGPVPGTYDLGANTAS